ncbi:MAG: cytochrome c3 family protein [Thermodesulfobacteriota bacterium]|jgi:predicted CXXCH cytochrome family protein
MKRSVLFFLLFLGGLSLLVYCLERSPHDFAESECGMCHRGDPAAASSLLPEGSTVACTGCHGDILRSGFMHPVDVRPVQVRIPRDFPLARSGMIVCTTCHGVHSAHIDTLGQKTYFLRRQERGRAFCAGCHSQATLAGGGHELGLGEAHFQSKYISTGYGQELDETSKNCISCHDGTYGSSVSISSGVWQHGGNYASAGVGLDRKHPIGIDYEEARAKHGRKTDLRPLAMVDPRIQLYDGRLGCGTCHNPYSHLDKDLVMSNERSALCFACHQMDE